MVLGLFTTETQRTQRLHREKCELESDMAGSIQLFDGETIQRDRSEDWTRRRGAVLSLKTQDHRVRCSRRSELKIEELPAAGTCG